MRIVARMAAAALALAVVVGPAGAQQTELIVSLYGGGADHLADLSSSGPAAYFMPGYNLGASVGAQLSRYLAVHGDLTYTRNPARGATPFAGSDVNRFFYGAHLEARYPIGRGIAPFVFAGAGAVSVDQLGVDQFDPFTKPAAMYGGGIFFSLPRSRIEAFGEVKGLTYKWDRAGFNRMMFDVTYSVGVSYRLAF